MSWEGYQQNLCINGHSYDTELLVHCITTILKGNSGHLGSPDSGNPWDETDEYPKCPFCQGKCVWWNLVDTTNGSFNVDENGNETDERIDGYVELTQKEPARYCTCNACGNQHSIAEPTYQLPSAEVGHHIL